MADINNTGVGAALTWLNSTTSSLPVSVNNIAIQVFYAAGGGFTVSDDTVLRASRIAELRRTEGVYREDESSTAYVPVGDVTGDYPRIPSVRNVGSCCGTVRQTVAREPETVRC